MDALVVTDNDSVLIDPYWLGIILAQTYTAIKKNQIEDEDIDDLIEFFGEDQWRLEFTKKYIRHSSFEVFYKYCYYAMKDYINTDSAKVYYVDWKKGTWRTRDSNGTLLSDYLNLTIKEQLLALGNIEGYFDNTEEKKKDFQNYVDTVLLWWGRFLDFLKENYGKPKQEQNN